MKRALLPLLAALVLASSAPVLADGDGGSLLVGTNWQLTSLAGTPSADGVKSTLQIAGDGMVSGNGGCNGYGGSATIDGSALTFSQMRSTMMACGDAAMQQEHGLLTSLETVRSYSIAGNTLELHDAGGATVATFAAAQ